jgi:hypothetical protein
MIVNNNHLYPNEPPLPLLMKNIFYVKKEEPIKPIKCSMYGKEFILEYKMIPLISLQVETFFGIVCIILVGAYLIIRLIQSMFDGPNKR